MTNAYRFLYCQLSDRPGLELLRVSTALETHPFCDFCGLVYGRDRVNSSCFPTINPLKTTQGTWVVKRDCDTRRRTVEAAEESRMGCARSKRLRLYIRTTMAGPSSTRRATHHRAYGNSVRGTPLTAKSLSSGSCALNGRVRG